MTGWKTGDHGQRYEVSYEEDGKRHIIGWSNYREGVRAMTGCIRKHPCWSKPQIMDRVKKQLVHNSLIIPKEKS
jgi:hypothetical protein